MAPRDYFKYAVDECKNFGGVNNIDHILLDPPPYLEKSF